MRTSLDLNALLDVVYEQVALLLNARNFSVTLFDANRSILYFPLNIRDDRLDPLDPREAANGLLEYVIHEKNALLLTDQVPRRAGLLGLTPPVMPVVFLVRRAAAGRRPCPGLHGRLFKPFRPALHA